jgi:hypothetical protein
MTRPRPPHSTLTRASALVVAIALFGSPTARAQTEPDTAKQVEDLNNQGVDLLSSDPKRNAAEALRLFERADSLKSSPKTIAQRGVAEQWLQRWAASEQHLSSALARSDDPWVAKNQAVIEKARTMVRSHLGELVITGSPSGAQIWVQEPRQNPRVLGALPLPGPVWVAPGELGLQINAPGYQPGRQITTVEPGKRQVVNVTLDKLKLIELSPPEEALAAERGAPSSAGPPAWLGWTAVGVGGAVLVGALIYTVPCMSVAEGAVCNRSVPSGLVVGGLGLAAAATGSGLLIYRSRHADVSVALGSQTFITLGGSL